MAGKPEEASEYLSEPMGEYPGQGGLRRQLRIPTKYEAWGGYPTVPAEANTNTQRCLRRHQTTAKACGGLGENTQRCLRRQLRIPSKPEEASEYQPVPAEALLYLDSL
jgi:hypothetical protein